MRGDRERERVRERERESERERVRERGRERESEREIGDTDLSHVPLSCEYNCLQTIISTNELMNTLITTCCVCLCLHFPCHTLPVTSPVSEHQLNECILTLHILTG